ncbi:hypothetical protein KMT30_23020 [Streptomyces sp. IBSBF 2953]|uniref:hypothetical protein n=1 Tax=Streptomyces TaxID=1883 RepID=UPI00211A68BE|nr:hypothetical protein [Streptomyces hayashii]
MADLYVHTRIIDGTAHRPYMEPAADDSLRLGEKIPNGWRTFAGGRFEHDGMSFEGAAPDWLRKMWRSSSPVPDERRQTLASALAMLDISPADPADQIHAALLAKIPTEEYRNFVIELIQLPQLFIAV